MSSKTLEGNVCLNAGNDCHYTKPRLLIGTLSRSPDTCTIYSRGSWLQCLKRTHHDSDRRDKKILNFLPSRMAKKAILYEDFVKDVLRKQLHNFDIKMLIELNFGFEPFVFKSSKTQVWCCKRLLGRFKRFWIWDYLVFWSLTNFRSLMIFSKFAGTEF